MTMLRNLLNLNLKNGSRNCVNVLNTIRQYSSTDSYTPVYKFPYIHVLSIVNRLKLYNTVLTAVAVPSSLILQQLQYIDFDTVILTAAVGLNGCAVLYSLGMITNKFVGFLYVDATGEKLKISYADFWGKRKNDVIPIKDVVPFSDLPFSYTDGVYLKLKRFSTNDTLKINLKYGIVLNKEKFNKAFS